MNFGMFQYSELYEAGKWAAQRPEKKIGMFQSGTATFVASNVMNLDGKVNPEGPVRGDVVFEDVSFVYSDGEHHVLKNISFHVKPGQSIALLGSTGSGKTSLVNLLPRFHEYTGVLVTTAGVPPTVGPISRFVGLLR